MKAMITFLILFSLSLYNVCLAEEQLTETSADDQISALKRFYKLLEQADIPTENDLINIMGVSNEFDIMFEDSEIEKNTPTGKSEFFNYLRMHNDWFFGKNNSKECEIFISNPLERKEDIVRYEVLTICDKQVVSRIIFSVSRYKNDIMELGYIRHFFVNNESIYEIVKREYPNPRLYK